MNWYKKSQVVKEEVYPGVEATEGHYTDIGHGAYSTSGKKRFIWFLDSGGKFLKKEVTGTTEGHFSWVSMTRGSHPISAYGRYEEDDEGRGICSVVLNISYDTINARKEFLYKRVLESFPAGTRFISYNTPM